MRHLLGALIVGIITSLACSNGAATATKAPPSGGLTSAERAQLATLESRPLQFPGLGPGGVCPYTSSEARPYLGGVPALLFGTTPVWGNGGPHVTTAKALYASDTFYTDPSVKGPVLIRGGFVGSETPMVFIGQYAAGPVLYQDVVAGASMDVHNAAVLPAAHAPKSPGAAPGWGIWTVQMGYPSAAKGCGVVQVDTLAGSEEIGIGPVPD